MTHHHIYDSIETIEHGFRSVGYLTSRHIATTLYLAYHLGKPLLVEGPAGVGKTELAKKAAEGLGLMLIRLQCYEGLDESKALYEWKYGKQLLYTQILKDKLNDLTGGKSLEESIEALHRYDDIFFTEHFLEPRPLLAALQQEKGCVLLIDEVDKSDDEFEAFLLEVLSDFQVSIPEIGTIRARTRPLVFLTSNNTRDLSDALKRRCLHLYIPLPDPKLEREIVMIQVPGISEALTRQLVAFVQKIRELDIKKVPSISETIDWARVLILLNRKSLSPEIVRDTLHAILKFEADIDVVRERLPEMTRQILNGREGLSHG
ncbi:MAG: MoxR family ATPase [Deltaproteobacteria bacterium]|nr:MoxR family ATPase [Deltaproteobacteria bacterium]